MVRLERDKKINGIVSHLPQVRSEIRNEADERGQRARAKLAGHRRTGRAHVDVEHQSVDSLISLNDESVQAAMSIEYGHSWRGRRVEGLYILSSAAGLA